MWLCDVVVVTVITINYSSTKAIYYTIYPLISDSYADHIDHIAMVHQGEYYWLAHPYSREFMMLAQQLLESL
jgi:hypothetical protein